MHAYLLAAEIEPVETNRVYVALPLHCTVVPWFYAAQTPAEIIRAVQDVIQQHAPINVTAGEPDSFGNNADVPVNRIADETPWQQLHQALRVALKPLGIEDIEPSWVDGGYVPHITRQRSGRFEKGRKHYVTRMYLAEALVPDRLQQKKIISKFTLGSK